MYTCAMGMDAVVLAGGRSTRLGGEPKALLVFEGSSLLSRTVDAASAARRTAVVGDTVVVGDIAVVGHTAVVGDVACRELTAGQLPDGIILAREDPAFGGPAAGIAAGLNALRLAGAPSKFTLVLACDMPLIAMALPALFAALQTMAVTSDGVIAVDSAGRRQQLAGVYRTASLAAAIQGHQNELENLAVRALFDGLELVAVPVPRGTTDDIDTWADAERYGIASDHRTAILTREKP